MVIAIAMEMTETFSFFINNAYQDVREVVRLARGPAKPLGPLGAQRIARGSGGRLSLTHPSATEPPLTYPLTHSPEPPLTHP